MANHPDESITAQPPRKDWDVDTGIRRWWCPMCRKRYGLPVAQRVAKCPSCDVYLVRSASEVGK